MVVTQPHPAIQQALALAGQALQAGDLAGAERLLAPLFAPGLPAEPVALNLLALIRLNQSRFAEALAALAPARAAAPREPMLPFNQGRALAGLGRADEAVTAFRAALKLRPDFVDAFYEMGSLLLQQGRLDDAESAFRQLLRVMPGHAPAKLMLGNVLIDAGKPADAEAPLRRALLEAQDPRLKAVVHANLGLALRRQRKDADAMAEYDRAQAMDPAQPGLAVHRAEALQNLGRYDESIAVFEQALARAPDDPELHQRYNDLLYRLNRKDAYLTSYDRAPKTDALLMGKAFFLSCDNRSEEAYGLYRDVLARNPDDRLAAASAANMLSKMKRHDEAASAFADAIARHPGDTELLSSAAITAILRGEPEQAVRYCAQGLAANPAEQMCLAAMGTAWRLMEDERDEVLNGYDTLIQSFDLEPPEGFSSMAEFNAALDSYLDRMHPQTREFINQSLRGGTQTPDKLFGAGQPLIQKLQARIDEAVTRYIANLKADETHPYLSRRGRDFRYSGSWSSRLRDCGFHVNHIHPEGWISSCFYIAVPDAVKDTSQRQGWIKFGEPSLEVALKNPIRRAIQPAPGRLVLFPSYMWHGTIAFRDTAARTTIAFDAVPTP